MSATVAGRRQKIFKKALAKTPEISPKKRNLHQNINDSKSHNRNFLKKNISAFITRNLIIFKKPRKMTSDFFNKSLFVHIFQWTSSECFLNFRFSSRKSQSQQKTSEKDHLTYNTVSFKKHHSFCKPQVTWHWKIHAPETKPKTFLTLQIFQQTSGWCQKKH